MKEVVGISEEVMKSLNSVVDEDVEKIIEDEGDIEKVNKNVFGISLKKVLGRVGLRRYK